MGEESVDYDGEGMKIERQMSLIASFMLGANTRLLGVI
jgi:hypothetical protein